MGEKFHALSGYAKFSTYDPDVMAKSCRALMRTDTGLLLVGERAMIGCIVFPLFMAQETVAQELFWWSETPGVGRDLLNVAEHWAKTSGAKVLLMLALESNEADRVETIYRRRGYETAERSYMKVL